MHDEQSTSIEMYGEKVLVLPTFGAGTLGTLTPKPIQLENRLLALAISIQIHRLPCTILKKLSLEKQLETLKNKTRQ